MKRVGWQRLDKIRKISVRRRKHYKDKRDWKQYNNKLVREVELILDFPFEEKNKAWGRVSI